MLQRLSIARALLHDPHILLLDEPYTGLDQDAAAMLDDLLRTAQGEGHTIVMVSHQLDRSVQLASRALILSRGLIAYDAPTASLTELQLAAEYTRVTRMASTR
jgi:heme exporter protein A